MYLFDTTFFLPFIGVKSHITTLREDLKKLLETDELKKHICQTSILELKWIAIKEYNKSQHSFFLEVSNSVVQSLYYGNQFKLINPWESAEILYLADEVLQSGHTDFMDCLLLGTAKFNKFGLVSEDKKFGDIIERLNWELNLVNWKSFRSKIIN